MVVRTYLHDLLFHRWADMYQVFCIILSHHYLLYIINSFWISIHYTCPQGIGTFGWCWWYRYLFSDKEDASDKHRMSLVKINNTKVRHIFKKCSPTHKININISKAPAVNTSNAKFKWNLFAEQLQVKVWQVLHYLHMCLSKKHIRLRGKASRGGWAF